MTEHITGTIIIRNKTVHIMHFSEIERRGDPPLSPPLKVSEKKERKKKHDKIRKAGYRRDKKGKRKGKSAVAT